MKLLTGLFRAARKRVMTTDNDMGLFRDKLTELVENKDKLSDEDVVAKVEELKGFTSDLPDDDEKAKLLRFLEDFKAIKEQDAKAALEAGSMVADLFEKLDTAAMQDVPEVSETTESENEEVEEESEELADGADETTEEVVEETLPPESEETKDDVSLLNEYTAEEIYQYVKNRLIEEFGLEPIEAGDAACDDGEEVEEKEEKEEVVTDNAPRIPVTMNNVYAAKGSITEMFEQIKRGGR